MKKILYIGSEVMPFAATGGLGDVMGSLPAAVKNLAGDEADVRVVMPLYGVIAEKFKDEMKLIAEFTVNLSWRKLYCGVNMLEKDGVIYYFLDNKYYFERNTLYGNYDDGERFAYFSLAAIDMLGVIGFYPDVINANDWQSALSIVYLERKYRQIEGYENIRTVFTIHNIEYQGKYDMAILGDVFGLDDSNRDIVEYGGCMNLMKAAIVCADRVTTVSPRYSQEILSPEYSHGLDAILRENSYKLCGILNGIDYEYYNPATDEDIARKYTWRSLDRKNENKRSIQEDAGLPVRDDVPLIAVISRLATHKGLDLVTQMMYNLLENNDVQFVVLGCGEPAYEEFFARLRENFPDKAAAYLLYNRALSKKIYAAADIFMMPSKSEPCGLSQMIASRYGAIPVVRETGGLFDSIKGYWEDGKTLRGNGFTFANYRADELLDRTLAAINLWNDKEKRKKFVGKIMRTDFSWTASAKDYIDMYESL